MAELSPEEATSELAAKLAKRESKIPRKSNVGAVAVQDHHLNTNELELLSRLGVASLPDDFQLLDL
jgi:hypothetical protein